MAQAPDVFTVEEIMQALAAGALTREEAQAELARIGIDINEIQQELPSEPTGVAPGVDAPAPEVGPALPPTGPVTAGGPAQDPFLELERDPETIFRGFATQQFGPELSGLARQSALRQFAPAQLSFLLGQGAEDIGPEGGRFRDFLRTGGEILDPSQLASGIQGAAQRARQPGGERVSELFGNNQQLFNLVNSAALARTNPLFRGAFDRASRNKFSQFQEQGPGKSFLQFLGGQGGRLFQ